MRYIILLINLWAAGLAFPQRNEDQQPDVFPKIRETRQATRRSLKKYVPFVDGKPILIPDTEPEKREKHIYDAEAEKAFLQSYLFPQTEPDGKPAKKLEGDLKTVQVKNKEYETSIKKTPNQRIPTSKPVSQHQNDKDGHGSKKSKMPESSNVRDALEGSADANDYEYDSPVVVESLTKEESDEYEYDSPVVVESLTKESDEYDSPVVVESLMKEQKEAEHAIVKDALTKETETDKILSQDEYDKPVVIKSLVKKVQPNENIQYKDEDYDEPVVIETVIKKPYKTKGAEIGDYDTPVVIEALVKKDSTKIKPTVLDKGKSKYDEYGKLTVSEAFTKNTEIKGGDDEADVYASGKEKDNQYIKANSKGNKTFTKKGVSKVKSKPSTVKTSNYKRKANKHKLKPTKSSIKHEGKPYVEDIHEVEPLGGRASGTGTQPTFESKTDTKVDGNEDHPISITTDGATSSSRNFLPLDSNVWSFLASIQSQERSKFKPCQTANAQPGNCMPIQLCPVPASSVDELVSNVCVIDEVFVGFCCPEFPVETVNVRWDGLPLTHEQEGTAQKNSSGCGSVPESIDTGNIWPWMVTLVTTSNEVFCGGVLISERVVLAAAHCTKRIPLNQILVRVRSLGSPLPFENVQVVEIKRHAQYNPKSMLNDLALLKLSKKFQSATAICLPDVNQDYVGENGILLGWKAALGDTTNVEWLPIISKEDCRRSFSESILCTEPRAVEGTCNADGGAPLVLNLKGKFTLIGLLTWNRHECDGRQPTIFTRVSSFRKWIEKHSTEWI